MLEAVHSSVYQVHPGLGRLKVSLYLPRISVVTPSYNQVQFLGQTVRSVLDQGYPDLEYLIVDGGSTDGSVEILHKYENRLAYWTSRRDRGQSDALNEGFAHATGDILGWINSDDLLWPGALPAVGHYFAEHPEVDVVLGWSLQFQNNKVFYLNEPLPMRLEYLLYTSYSLPQDAIYWRRDVYEKIGLLDVSLPLMLDTDYFIRMVLAGVTFRGIKIPVGGFRCHTMQKTAGRQTVAIDRKNLQVKYWNKFGVSPRNGRLRGLYWSKLMLFHRGLYKIWRSIVYRQQIQEFFVKANSYLDGLAGEDSKDIALP